MRTKIMKTATGSIFILLLTAFSNPALASDYYGSGSPEFLYYVEGTGAYFLPEADSDVFFHLGRWYRRSGSSWSASVSLSGPWGAISVSNAPSVLVNLPVDFRTTLSFGRVPYRYVVDTRGGHDDYGPRYYNGGSYDDHDRGGYRRQWHSSGNFWFFIAPDFDHRGREDDRDDDRHRRRRRGRGRD